MKYIPIALAIAFTVTFIALMLNEHRKYRKVMNVLDELDPVLASDDPTLADAWLIRNQKNVDVGMLIAVRGYRDFLVSKRANKEALAQDQDQA